MLLIIYNKSISKEILLPNLHDADYKVELKANELNMKEDVNLYLEQSIRGWELVTDSKDRLFVDSESVERVLLKNEMILKITTGMNEILFVIVADSSTYLFPMRKFDLSRRGRITIGFNENNIISYKFRGLISGEHAALWWNGRAWEIQDLNSTNGTFVNNLRITGGKALSNGDEVYLFGLHLILVGNILLVGSNCASFEVKEEVMRPVVPQAIIAGQEGMHEKEEVYFNRAPRNLPVIFNEPVEIEAPPAPKQQKQKPAYMVIGPAFTMAIPMMLGVLMTIIAAQMRGGSSSTFMFTGLITAGGAAIVGSIWAVLNLNYSKKEFVEDEELRFNAYSNYLIEASNTIRSQYQHNTAAMNMIYPGAKEVLSYTTKSPGLWNRNFTHPDYLYVRMGLGEQPFQVEINIPKEKFSLINDALANKPKDILKEYKMLKQVPVGINLRDSRLVGLVGVGGRKRAVNLMHILTAQIAATHCYTDVKLAYIYDENNKEELADWECMRWFPHVWSEDREVRYMAANELEIHEVLFNLTNVIRTRAENAENALSKNENRIVKPHYILFVSDPKMLEGELLTKYIYEAKPEYGLTTLFLADSQNQLPNACETVIECSEKAMIYDLMDMEMEHRRVFTPDMVTTSMLLNFGVSIADVRVKELESSSEIPNSLTFMQMYNADTLDDLNVEDRWRRNRSYKSMKALIGKKAGNADCYLDIHEKFHGPHGLVAGTTGSGKSETLQTWMLSLAVNFSPEDVSFFIIDFKGGGMANLFTNLPHLAGQISNLSGNQVRRAMISIESENKRRQQLFAETNVNNIFDYTKLYKSYEVRTPLPHLFIIIDEFAELKREEPEFMQKLISVAQVGRSLGVHLILATQRPSGTVDDNIRSNAKFKLCLRVQDRQDSMDMLHKPDAAFLTQAGRCYLQVGQDELYELFQSGYSGAPYTENIYRGTQAAIITRTGRASVIGTRKVKGEDNQNQPNAKKKSQLDAVVDYLSSVAQKEGYAKSPQLWLPVLSEEILLDDLCGKERRFTPALGWPEPDKNSWSLTAVVGQYDDPEHQAQRPLETDFVKEGHLGVLGNVVSGKSTFLQTMLYSMMRRYSPEVVTFYIIDFSSHLLSVFEKAPHVGGIVTEQQEDRLKKFFHMFSGIMDERRAVLSGRNYSQYVRANGYTMPAICVVIDNYALLRERTNNAYESSILRIAREGIGYGVFLAVASGTLGHSDIPSSLADALTHLISLEQNDKFKYMDAIRRTHLDILPEEKVKGRGLAPVGEDVLEFQTALAVKPDEAGTMNAALEHFCTEMDQAWHGMRPKRIPEIPENPTFSLLATDQNYIEAVNNKQFLPFAYRMQDASILSIDLSGNHCWLISGRSRSGKTNVLKLLIMSAAKKDAELCIFEKETGGRMELAKLAAECGAAFIRNDQEVFNYMKSFQTEFVRRNHLKRALLEKDMEDEEIYEVMSREKPIFLFISSITDFLKIIYRPQGSISPMNEFFESAAAKGALHNILMIGCFSPEESAVLSGYPAFKMMADNRKGLHLGGELIKQKVFDFQNISAAEKSRPQKKGLAYVSDDREEGSGIEAVIPLAK